MGRIANNSVNYLSIDCDFFQKEKMFAVMVALGELAQSRALRLLLWMGRTEGLFIEMNDMTAARFASQELCNIAAAEEIKSLLSKLVEIGFFHLYTGRDGKQYLSSPSIIRDWQTIMNKSKRKVNFDRIPEPILDILNEENGENSSEEDAEEAESSKNNFPKNQEKTCLRENSFPKNSESIPSERNLLPKNSEGIPQRKEKKSKDLSTPPARETEFTPGIAESDYDDARKAVEIWNETFKGTKQEFPENDILPEKLVLQVRELPDSCKTPERFREAFVSAKNDDFAWTLWIATKNQQNFDQLIAKSGRRKTARSGPPKCGLAGGSGCGDRSRYSPDAFKVS